MSDHRDWLDLVLDEDWQPSRDEALTTRRLLRECYDHLGHEHHGDLCFPCYLQGEIEKVLGPAIAGANPHADSIAASSIEAPVSDARLDAEAALPLVGTHPAAPRLIDGHE